MTENDDIRQPNRRRDRCSRRGVLAAGAACLGTAVAGCSSITGSGSSGRSPSGSGVFENIGFEGQQLVIELADRHSVDRVNLIGPDGSRYGSSSVASGETRTTIQLLDIQPGDPFHYPTGDSTLVAVEGDEQTEQEINLSPAISLTKVRQYSGESANDFGNVEVTVQNEGTGPTWIYDVFFTDVPDSDAEQEGNGKGSPGVFLKKPEKPSETIIRPGETQTFVDSHPPFIFKSESACDGTTHQGKLHLKIATGQTLARTIEAVFNGEALPAESASFNSKFVCNDGEVTLGDTDE